MHPLTRTLTTLSLLLAASSARAAELPESARVLVPATWSEVVHADEAVDVRTESDWARAIGGEALLGLFAQLDRNGDVSSAQSLVQQAEGRTVQSASGWLPSLDASGAWSTGTPSAMFSSLTDSKSMDQYTASLDLSVPLTPWTAVPDQRAARADRLGAEADLDDARATAMVDVTTAWLDAVQTRESLAIVEEQLRVESELLSVVEARYAAGEVTGLDVLQQRQQLATTRADLPVARADVGRAERALAVLLRLPTSDLPALPDALPAPVTPRLPAPVDLVSQDPGVVSTLRALDARRSQLTSARAGLAPSLAATASTGIRYTELVDTEVTPTWSAGLSVSVPLFDGGATVGTIRERAGARDQALIAAEQAVVDLVREVEDALATFEQARDVRLAADEAEQMALDALTAARAGYAAGTSTYNSVLTAVQTARSARQSALQAERDHVDAAMALVSLSRATWTSRESS